MLQTLAWKRQAWSIDIVDLKLSGSLQMSSCSEETLCLAKKVYVAIVNARTCNAHVCRCLESRRGYISHDDHYQSHMSFHSAGATVWCNSLSWQVAFQIVYQVGLGLCTGVVLILAILYGDHRWRKCITSNPCLFSWACLK